MYVCLRGSFQCIKALVVLLVTSWRMQQAGECKLPCKQVLVEAETQDGRRHSIMLQNAETVRLIGPQAEQAAAPTSAVSVTELQTGQLVYLHLQGAARHTGISIEEHIVEK